MVAGWAKFKRHSSFFAALHTLKKMGEMPKVILVGYPADMTKEDVLREAEYFGVRDQIELHEWITQEEVNRQLNRAKVNVLWSRKEGFNRAIIEGMFAGVPCILRNGHNFGQPADRMLCHPGRAAGEAALDNRKS